MLFCLLAKSQSVWDITNGFRSATENLNHLGIEKAPSKSTISYQNKRRDWELFRDYNYKLLNSLVYVEHLPAYVNIPEDDNRFISLKISINRNRP